MSADASRSGSARRQRGPYNVQTHGHCRHRRDDKSPTYKTWEGMHRRCRRNDRGYKDVAVCDRWSSFEAFLEDMGERPSLEHSIDRIDPAKGYEPSNCRWATQRQQARNKRSNVYLTHPISGETMCAADWADRIGVRRSTLHWRLARGWPLQRVLSPTDHRLRGLDVAVDDAAGGAR